jgi:hypothetical protein
MDKTHLFLFNDTLSNSDCIVSDVEVMKDDFKRIQKEAVMTSLKVLPWCLPARPEETTDIIIRDSLWTAI